MAAFDPMGDLSSRQPHHDSPPQPSHPLLHQLVDPFDHGVDPSGAEHDERDPIAYVDPRRLPGLMRLSLYLHRLREPPERGWSCVSCSERPHAFCTRRQGDIGRRHRWRHITRRRVASSNRGSPGSPARPESRPHLEHIDAGRLTDQVALTATRHAHRWGQTRVARGHLATPCDRAGTRCRTAAVHRPGRPRRP